MSKTGDGLIIGSIAVVALLAVLWPRKSVPGVPGGGGGVWEPETSNEDYTGGQAWPAPPPVNGWEPDTQNDPWWVEPLPGQSGGSSTMTTGGYRVPDPDPNKDYFAHIVSADWYIEIAGMAPAVAIAQANFDYADAAFAAGKISLNERDQAGVKVEIEQKKAAAPGENAADLNVLQGLLAYLQAHPEISRYDIRDRTSF